MAKKKRVGQKRTAETIRAKTAEFVPGNEGLPPSIEELEISEEELRTLNEQLQTTVAELDTSREELRRLNEQLQLVNSELEDKVCELESSNNDLSNLLSSTEIATLYLDRRLCLRWFSPATTRLLPLRATDAGRPLIHFARQFTDADLLTDAEAVLERRVPLEHEIQDDTGCWYLRRISPYRTEDDQIEGVVITFVDITRSKQDALALEAAEQRFARFMQHLPGLAWIKDPEGRYVYADDAALDAFRRTREQLYGRTDNQLFPAAVAAQFQQNDRRALEAGKGIQSIETLQHADGTEHHSMVAKFSISNAEGIVAFIGGIAIDITERLQAEESLRVAQQQLQLITDSMAVGLTRCSRDMRYLWVNEGYARMLGRSADEIIGRPIANILGEELFEQLRPHFEQVLAGQRYSYEQEIEYAGTQSRWVRADYSPIFDESGEPDSWVAVVADISARKLAEQALRDSEARKSAILTASLDAIISIDAEGMILEWNPAAEKMFGLSRAEVLGKEMAALIIPPRLRQQHRDGLARYLATGDGPVLGKRLELPALRSDGTEFPAEVAIAKIDVEGPPTFEGFIRDITERKEGEAVLIELNEQLEQLVAERTANTDRLLEQAPDAVVIINRQGEITRINQLLVSMFGYMRDELVGQPIEILLPEKVRPGHPELRNSYFADPRIRAMGLGLDLHARHKDGHEFAVEIQLTPLTIDGAQVAAAAIRDVTERKQFREAQAQLSAIMHNASTAVWVLNRDGLIVNWNLGAERLLGYAAEEIIKQHISRLVPPQRSGEIERDFERLADGQLELDYKTVRLHKDGTPIDVSLTKSQILQSEGSDEMLVIARDIREQRRLEQQMAELADSERQRLGRELHDTLGQECTAISMFVATLKKQLGGSSKQNEIIERLESCADRAKKQLRLMAKGLFPVDLDAAGLQVALEDLADETSSAHELDCRFECLAPIHLQDNFVATQLYLIVREAVHNAVKHAAAKRILIRVEVSEGLLFIVRDDGVGLDAATSESAGMGLRIMQHRCGIIGGQLKFESTNELGTTVMIFLPGGAHQPTMPELLIS